MKLATFRFIRSICFAVTLSLAAHSVSAQGIFDDPIDSGDASGGLGGAESGGSGLDSDALDPQAEFERANTAAEALMSEQKWSEALAEFNKVLALDRTFAPAHFGRAQCFQQLGAPDDAIEAYSRAIVSPSASRYEGLVTQSHLERGKLYLDTGRFREAADDFAQAVAQDPTNPENLFQQGKALLRLVLTSPSQGADQAGQRSLILAIGSLDRAIELDPNNGEAYLERGRVLSRIRETEFAIEDLEKAVAMTGPSSAAAADLGLAYSQRANVESSKIDGDSQEIVDDLRAAVKSMNGFVKSAKLGEKQKSWEPSDPTEVRAESMLISRAETMIALANELVGDETKELYQQAIRDTTTIIDQSSDPLELARAHFARAHAYRMLDDLDQAIAEYTTALKFFPTYTEAYLRRGICFFHQQEYDKALQDFAAASTDPRNPYQFEPRASLWEGLTHSQRGDQLDAIRAYSRAIRASDSFIPAYLNRGLAYMNVGRNDRAVSDFNNVLRRDDNNEQAKTYRAQALERVENERRDAESTYGSNVGPL
ncbi:MAG: tetratricopeptide repeat protein [Planctomycetaceae bacterium]|nr:tetratricopeptide repeat protein [Planctomycetaceae bacterium]